MPLIDEYYYCASDPIPPQRLSDEKRVQTLPLSSDLCFCYGSWLCIWILTCNESRSNTCSSWRTGVAVPRYRISTRGILSRLILYLFVLVRLFLGSPLKFHYEQYISGLGCFPNPSLLNPTAPRASPPPSKNTMKQFQTTLPPVRRIVTAHDISGREIIRSDSSMLAKVERAFAKVAATDTYPLTVCIPIQRCSGKNMGDRLFPFQRQQYRVSFIRSLGVFQWVG